MLLLAVSGLVPPLRSLPLLSRHAYSSSSGAAFPESTSEDGTVHVLHGLVSPGSLAALREAAREAMFESEGDTVDGSATYLAPLIESGRVVGRGPLTRLAQPVLEERVLPYVRERTGCGGAVVCDALVRRYLPGERLGLSAHFDVSAFATAVLPLSPPGEYAGGFYVQSEAHASSRRFVPLGEGDLCMHQYDVMHGVDVRGGEWLRSPAVKPPGANLSLA